MQYRARDIAALIGGTVEGNEESLISKFSKIEEADAESICFYANEKYAEYLEHTKASVILVSRDFSLKTPSATTLIRCENPYHAAAQLLSYYEEKIKNNGIESHAYIHSTVTHGSNPYIAGFAYLSEGVKLGDEVKIFPHVFIGKNVTIGHRVIIHSGVKIYADCVVGDDCILHSGVVIGSDGFGFAPKEDGSYSKIPQIGNVILESNVEIGANTVIDRATMGSTKIMSGTKLDNLIQIAHNVVIGKNTVIAAQTGISGSTKIGSQAMIGGQVGIVGHITIGDRARINAQSGVSKSIADGEAVTGSPAWDYTKMLKAQSLFRKLPEIWERLIRLENRIEE